MKSERAALIRRYLHEHGPSSLAALSQATGASLPTLRRDLTEMERQGLVIRDHGGASLAESHLREAAFEAREALALPEKRAIAAAAHALLTPGATVFLDAGTTVLQLARRIRAEPLALSVFTNCLPIAQTLAEAEGVKVTLLGGAYRPENASITGPLAEAMLESLWVQHLFLGCGSVAPDLTLTSADESEARLNARMISRAAQATLLADPSKFGPRLTYGFAPLAAVHRVITTELPPDTAAAIQAAGAALIQTRSPS
ncbi:DeoR/GlpR family DNA-binding transcription regulator [Stagnihabitans tardus]|uniref:DeoR family transcriptional regulator n=1 Tax=Stagnihabitans tardus TaxID=2699202 RepID=A0AAE4Y783_9RHOB|nr:DeoR/GlpR family DNA-binding transcription regulator [Stagnihabitans tardus]NBZ87162.1 DeoR family transcriptional regulator [Stagnihabitans tardus]